MDTIEAIIILAAIDWSFLKQRPQHLAEAFARRGSKVMFVENTGVRTPRFSDWPRLLNRLHNFLQKAGHAVEKGQVTGVEVLSPLAMPFPYNPLSLAYNRRHVGGKIRRFLDQHHLSESQTVFFSYLGTPLALAMADEFRWGSVVYDLVSDPKQVEPKLAPFEELFLQKADLTLFTSATLCKAYGDQSARSLLFRDGYNLGLLDCDDAIPDEVQRLSRPRFLYLGGINRKVDGDFLTSLADAYPGGSIILVGPVTPAEITLPERPNVFLFPARSRYTEIAGYLRASDAAIIPYRADSYAGMMHPAKVNEYLVFGLPIIATKTEELRHLEAELGATNFYLADSPGGFVMAAQRALAEDSPERREARRALTRLNSWDGRAEKLTEIIVNGR
ncbi:MAG: hypothetical protein M0Z41_15265 [Peptococcaceae bacterium]|nr:hypothetical protein [Peptococcaceae bacterium]